MFRFLSHRMNGHYWANIRLKTIPVWFIEWTVSYKPVLLINTMYTLILLTNLN